MTLLLNWTQMLIFSTFQCRISALFFYRSLHFIPFTSSCYYSQLIIFQLPSREITPMSLPLVAAPSIFTTLSHGPHRYRVLHFQHRQTLQALINMTIFWLAVSAVQAGALIEYLLQGMRVWKQGTLVMGCAMLSVMGTGALAAWHWRRVSRMLLFSLGNLAVLLCSLTGMGAAGVALMVIPTSIYIVVEILGSICLLANANLLMPKLLAMLQLMAIILHLDGRLTCDLVQVYFGLVILGLLCMVAITTMLLLWAANVLHYRQHAFSIKHLGMGVILCHCCSVMLAAMLPLAQALLGLPVVAVGLAGLVMNVITIAYGSRYRDEIVLVWCRVEKVKAYDQYITLVKMPKQCIEGYAFQRKSSNWYQKINLSQTLTTIDNPQSPMMHRQPPQSLDQTPTKCLICLQLQPCMIWMPCGHLTVCEICCDRMFDSRNSNCLLCKDVPQAVYHVAGKCRSASIGELSTRDGSFGEGSIEGEIRAGIEKSMSQGMQGEVLYIRSAYLIKIA